MSIQKNIVWFDEVGKEDVDLVGGKGANLGEMTKMGFPVPPGFIVTSHAYFNFIEKTNLKKKIEKYLSGLNYDDPSDLERVSKSIRKDIIAASMQSDLAKLIIKYYLMLSEYTDASRSKHASFIKKIKAKVKSDQTLVAIRSSATAEDLPSASFAGQQETYLNVKGEANVVEKIKEAWSSLFTARAIYYRFKNNFAHLKVGIAIPVQKMTSSVSSGVMFTIDPMTNDKNKIIIEAIFGLGELIVQGAVTPDHYEIAKTGFKILNKEVATQKYYLPGIGKRKIDLPKKAQSKQKLSDDKILELAKIGFKLEKHYYFPQDIEWGIEDNKIYILQTRPITTIKSKQKTGSLPIALNLKNILSGSPASPGIGTGKVTLVKTVQELSKIKEGDVLVAVQTNPDFVPAMKKADAIVTDKGGRTSHAAIVSRELGIPAVVGTEKATKILSNNEEVTVDGSTGKIYQGRPSEDVMKLINMQKVSRLDSPLKTATKIYVNLADPTRVTDIGKLNVDGIGLLRAEFILADIGIHPKRVIEEKKNRWFINRLASQIAIFCQSFGPKRPVVYRTTDFKTNEYRNLKYGYRYEKEEENPMIGYRGAFRYIADPSVFEMEIAAIKKVRNEMNLKNLHLMIPFVRTPNELLEVKKIISAEGLSRTSNFKLWIMVEIPSNVILIEEFIKTGIDGISIGSNDLTQLILGVDRDNSLISEQFTESDPAVLWAIEKVVKTCHKHSITSSICGQAPSDSPDLVEKLVKWGITSISVNVDALVSVREKVYQIENNLFKK